MAKINVNAWAEDKARRDARIEQGNCPMCNKIKRTQDIFCGDECCKASLNGIASQF